MHHNFTDVNLHFMNSYINSYVNYLMKYKVKTTCILTLPKSPLALAAACLIVSDEDEPDSDGDQGLPDLIDDADFCFCAAVLGPGLGTPS